MSSTTCSSLLAAFCAARATCAFAVVGGGCGAIYSALADALPLVHVRDESSGVDAAIEASLAAQSMQVACVTSGEAVFRAMSAMPTARSEGARLLLLYGCSNPSAWGRFSIQPTEPGTVPADFYGAGTLLKYGALISHPEQLPRALSAIAVGMQCPAGFVAALGLTQAVQGALAPQMAPVSIEVALPGPSPAAVQRCARAARGRLAVLAGFGARHAAEEVRELVRRTGATGLTTPRAKGVLRTPCIGIGGVEDYYAAGERPDYLLVLGSRLAESSCFWDPQLLPTRELIHVDLDPSCFGAAFPDVPTYGVVSELRLFLRALLAELQAGDSA